MRLLPLILLLLLPVSVWAQPVRETRGVWLATVMKDGGWPNPDDTPTAQASHLRDLIREAHQIGINTVYFQAVARGDAYYPSNRLPWAPISGQAGRDPGFDPLAVVINEAHRLGMELHAWFNVFRVGDRETKRLFAGVADPPHVTHARPEWVKAFASDWWIDPASEAAQAWLLDNVMEIVRRYDVDGVQFDFIRYPAGGLSGDEMTFAQQPRGFDELDDWRRANVSRFVAAAGQAIRAEKPWLKVGATPLGNYQGSPEWNALLGYSDVFQESRAWLQAGYLDYLAPQVYYSTGTAPEKGLNFKSPDFIMLSAEWIDEGGQRLVIPGMAAYKATRGVFPAEDMLEQIRTVRLLDAAGHAFFRYDDMAALSDLIRPLYSTIALPPAFAFRSEARRPSAPRNLAVQNATSSQLILSWSPAQTSAADPLRAYVVYRSEGRTPNLRDPDDIYQVLPASSVLFKDSRTPDASVHYAVVAQSRLGMMSAPSNTLSVPYAPVPLTPVAVAAPSSLPETTPPQTVLDEPEPIPVSNTPPTPVSQPDPTPSSPPQVLNESVTVYSSTVSVDLSESTTLTIEVFDTVGRRWDISHTQLPAGPSEIEIDTTKLEEGYYICRISTDTLLKVVPIVVED